MSTDLKNYLKLLFDEGQKTCFSNSPKGFKVSDRPKLNDVFVCINALHPTNDLNPQKNWHSKYSPRRADDNVICFRNFLIELDDMPLEDQLKLIEARKLPVSAITYSGSKSYHFMICLEEPLKNIQEYRSMAQRIHKLVPEADSTSKNPSRFSRLPTKIRPDTSKEQKLISLNTRIKKADLEQVLPKPEIKKASTNAGSKRFMPTYVLEACYEPDDIIMQKNLGGRNHFFFWLGQRLKEMELEHDKRQEFVQRAYDNLINKSGFSLKEAYDAARI